MNLVLRLQNFFINEKGAKMATFDTDEGEFERRLEVNTMIVYVNLSFDLIVGLFPLLYNI